MVHGEGRLATNADAPDLSPSPISCDLGTENNRIVRAAIASDQGVASGIDCATEAMVRPGLKIFHNALFDLARLWEAGVEVTPPIFDTMLAFHMLYPRLPKTLETVASLYLDLERWKDRDKDESVQWDALVTHALYPHLRDALAVTGQLDCFETMMAALPVLVQTGLAYRIPFKNDCGGILCTPVSVAPDAGWVVVSGRYRSDEAMFQIASVLCAHPGEAVRDVAHILGIRAALFKEGVKGVDADAEDLQQPGPPREVPGEARPPHGDCVADDRLGDDMDEQQDVELQVSRVAVVVRNAPRPPGLAKLKRLYPAFFIWRDTLWATARTKRFVSNEFGRRVDCRGWSRRRLAQWVCESTLNDIMWEAIPPLQAELQAIGGRIAAVTDTEIVAIVPTSAQSQARALLDGMGWDAAGKVREP